MTVSYSRDQIRALAPDASSIKAATKLLNPGKWPVLEHDEQSVWGECKGSGKKPYLVQVDRSEPAFKCSCPSRKFPCKHGLALMLLLADMPDRFSPGEAPPRVSDWLESRRGRAEKKAERVAAKAAKPVDPEAIKKREDKRRGEVEAGLQDFERWLQDVVRQGPATLPGRERAFWSQPAARLVDAKAPGTARYVHRAKYHTGRPGNWVREVMAVLGQAHLLRRAFAGYEQLAPEQQADVRGAVGWPLDQNLIRAQETTPCAARVLGISVTETERLRQQRIWLQEEESGRHAMILSFAHGNRPFELILSPGTKRQVELAYFPSAYPLRALLKAQHDEDTVAPVDRLDGPSSLTQALDQTAAAMARNPWLDRLPWSLRGMRLSTAGDHPLLVDDELQTFPVDIGFEHVWDLAALTGGRPADLFGEWRPDGFMPLGCLAADGYVAFPCEEMS